MSDKKRLLIIDDEAAVTELLIALFSEEGYDVQSANDSTQAMAKIIEKIPDGVLLDVRFEKGDDGLTLLRRIRSFHHDDMDIEDQIRNIPVIVLTGAGENMKPLFELEGVVDFLQKPFDSLELKKRVAQILQ